MRALSPQYLEEDRRRAALSAKEARSNRRKDDRQLKEYVHTLEVHLDQVQQYTLIVESWVLVCSMSVASGSSTAVS